MRYADNESHQRESEILNFEDLDEYVGQNPMFLGEDISFEVHEVESEEYHESLLIEDLIYESYTPISRKLEPYHSPSIFENPFSSTLFSHAKKRL